MIILKTDSATAIAASMLNIEYCCKLFSLDGELLPSAATYGCGPHFMSVEAGGVQYEITPRIGYICVENKELSVELIDCVKIELLVLEAKLASADVKPDKLCLIDSGLYSGTVHADSLPKSRPYCAVAASMTAKKTTAARQYPRAITYDARPSSALVRFRWIIKSVTAAAPACTVDNAELAIAYAFSSIYIDMLDVLTASHNSEIHGLTCSGYKDTHKMTKNFTKFTVKIDLTARDIFYTNIPRPTTKILCADACSACDRPIAACKAVIAGDAICILCSRQYANRNDIPVNWVASTATVSDALSEYPNNDERIMLCEFLSMFDNCPQFHIVSLDIDADGLPIVAVVVDNYIFIQEKWRTILARGYSRIIKRKKIVCAKFVNCEQTMIAAIRGEQNALTPHVTTIVAVERNS